MAIEINGATLGKVGFDMEELFKVKVIATDKDGFIREKEYTAANVPAAVLTDLEAMDE